MRKLRAGAIGLLSVALIFSQTVVAEPEPKFELKLVDEYGIELLPVSGLAYYLEEQKREEQDDYYGQYYLEVEENSVFVEVGTEAVVEETEEPSTELVVVEEEPVTEPPTEPPTEIIPETQPPVPETQPVTTQAPEPQPSNDIPLYRVAGYEIPHDLQRYAYQCLCDRGIGWYYPYFIAQMFQESHWNQANVSNGKFYGICQLMGKYHDTWKARAGLPPEADLINDPYANIYVGVFLMWEKFTATSDLNTAISAYYTGVIGQMNMTYVNDVLKWVPQMERIN